MSTSMTLKSNLKKQMDMVTSLPGVTGVVLSRDVAFRLLLICRDISRDQADAPVPKLVSYQGIPIIVSQKLGPNVLHVVCEPKDLDHVRNKS